MTSAEFTPDAALDLRHASKVFGGAKVLDDVNLQIHSGEIHAVVGQNGSGKSTLAKILSGFHQPEPGAEMQLFGHKYEFPISDEGRESMHFVHQDLGLVDSLNILDNIGLSHGYRTGRFGNVDWKHSRRRARDVLAGFDLDHLDMDAPISSLTASQQAIVAIARGLLGWKSETGTLVLDETTAALPHEEVEVLIKSVRKVVSRGAGVLYITHRLDEVFAFADRVSVLRDGRLVATRTTDSLTREELVALMVGDQVGEMRKPLPAREEIALSCRDLSGEGLRDIDFVVRKGEIVGVAGMLGSGRELIADAIVGASRRYSGTLEVEGRPVRASSPRQSMKDGFAFVPRDRLLRGIVPKLPVRENITLANLDDIKKNGHLRGKVEDAEVNDWIQAVGLRPPDPERQVISLSGGNQQKVLLARALRLRPAVLVLDEPTQGIDVGAKSAIYELLRETAARGTAIVLCTAEPEDMPDLCHRVIVMRGGTIVDELTESRLNRNDLIISCAS
ncbi:sugar ABC transporter ATP-binding protein [Rhodococcus globerulus]|uniref:Sugar ABC transporter ATP-binding protein n=1 Tax=Rhodococcus globerulus TaxID=33008 RepID=A0ABU4C3Q4_RHOGO|nr:sugar ABC transporter ATP-binding protein [Rhodococcus globerulus]MDV6271137.1 sugar ABC transporter ATP-binding protein [Rhodococcus globerulus]